MAARFGEVWLKRCVDFISNPVDGRGNGVITVSDEILAQRLAYSALRDNW